MATIPAVPDSDKSYFGGAMPHMGGYQAAAAAAYPMPAFNGPDVATAAVPVFGGSQAGPPTMSQPSFLDGISPGLVDFNIGTGNGPPAAPRPEPAQQIEKPDPPAIKEDPFNELDVLGNM
jgi:hypothetical protein